MKVAVWTMIAIMAFCVVSAMGQAQQTYSSLAPFVCDAVSLRPVSSFYQFSCRGIKVSSDGKTIAGSFYLFSNDEVQIAVPSVPYPPDIYDSHVTSVDSFTLPSGQGPGSYQFEWQVVDANNVKHTGTASGTWEDYVICGGRGCQYHAPKLLTFQTTVN